MTAVRSEDEVLRELAAEREGLAASVAALRAEAARTKSRARRRALPVAVAAAGLGLVLAARRRLPGSRRDS